MKTGLPAALALSMLLPACASTTGRGAPEFAAFDAPVAMAAAPAAEEENSGGGDATLDRKSVV